MAKLKLSFPVFRQPKAVTFGTGCRKSLAEIDSCDTALFISGNQEVATRILDIFTESARLQIEQHTIVKPAGEPTWDMIQSGAEFLRSGQFNRIVGVGGGSVLDWCRLAWAHGADLLPEPSTEVRPVKSDQLRPEFWLVPTTCATGAEAATVAVFNDRDGRKLPVVAEYLLADHVLLDGYFLDSLSRGALANSLCDAVSHAIESYVSIIPSSLAQDAAVAALRRILDVYADPSSPERSQSLIEAAYLGGLAASNASVGVVHAFAHTLSMRGIPHGHANGLGLIAGIRTNANTPAMSRLLAQTGFQHVDELCEAIRPILLDARTAEDAEIAAELRDDDYREFVWRSMQRDVCLRTNPQRLDDESLNRFLDMVIDTIQLGFASKLGNRKKGTEPFCRNGPPGASHKRVQSPFSYIV